MEVLTLTVPISVPTYRVSRLGMNWPGASIKIVVIDPQNEEILCSYTGAEATALMTTLNKIDLSVKSLHKRILEKLVTDGKLPDGAVTGAPD